MRRLLNRVFTGFHFTLSPLVFEVRLASAIERFDRVFTGFSQ